MISALRWTAMRAILMFYFINCEGQSHKTVSTNRSPFGMDLYIGPWLLKRKESSLHLSTWSPRLTSRDMYLRCRSFANQAKRSFYFGPPKVNGSKSKSTSWNLGILSQLVFLWFYQFIYTYIYICNGVEWSKDKTQAAESIKWRPQQAYGSNQFLLVQPQTVFSTPPKSSRSRIDKRTARATGNTRYRYSKIAPLDHKMADNCVSLARTNTLSSTIIVN